MKSKRWHAFGKFELSRARAGRGNLRIFVVTISAGDEAHASATRLVKEAGFELCEQTSDEGNIQDPYLAVDSSDAVVWLYSRSNETLGMTDYNPLYSDSVMQRIIRLGKPLLYYHFRKESEHVTLSPLLNQVTRCHVVQNLTEFSYHLEIDLRCL